MWRSLIDLLWILLNYAVIISQLWHNQLISQKSKKLSWTVGVNVPPKCGNATLKRVKMWDCDVGKLAS